MSATLVDYNTQLKNAPSVNSTGYKFAPQTPGGSLSSGITNTVTLSPVPLGVNGTDGQHYLYISGGVGTAEAVLITGGTAIAGSASGTVTFVPANNHSGSWTIQSASAGIKEASIGLGGIGVITLPAGQLAMHGILVLPTAISLVGQGASSNLSSINTSLVFDSGVSPGLCIADGIGTATGQGICNHQGFTVYGGGGTTGILIGGDPSSVFAPSSWTGSYVRFTNVSVLNWPTALEHRHGNFVIYTNCVFAGSSIGLYIPSDAGGNLQPVEFYGCLVSVPSGNAVQMDSDASVTTPIRFVGGQVSGMITGNQVDWDSEGTHYEPNTTNVGLFNVTGATSNRIRVSGGLMSVHGTALTNALNFTGTVVFANIKDVWLQADSGMTVTNFINYNCSSGGSLSIAGIDIAAAGTFTNLYTLSGTPINVSIQQGFNSSNSPQIAAGATTTFTSMSYPQAPMVTLTGGTVGGSGITAVAGALYAGQTGSLKAVNAQTFTSGATIGNTITLTAGLPYVWFFDGTKIWVN